MFGITKIIRPKIAKKLFRCSAKSKSIVPNNDVPQSNQKGCVYLNSKKLITDSRRRVSKMAQKYNFTNLLTLSEIVLWWYNVC